MLVVCLSSIRKDVDKTASILLLQFMSVIFADCLIITGLLVCK